MKIETRDGVQVLVEDDGRVLGTVAPFETVETDPSATLVVPDSLTTGVEAAAFEGEVPASVPSANAAPGQAQWRGVIALAGMTDDGRWFKALDSRELPLSWMCQIATAEGAHVGAQVAGRIDWMEQRGRVILGGGVYNDDEFGQYAAARAEDQSLLGVSMDAIGQGEYICTSWEMDPAYGPSCTDAVLVFENATICAATQLATPAFGASRIELVPPGESAEDASAALVRITAAAEALIPPEPTLMPEPILAAIEEPAALAATAGRPTLVRPPVEPERAWFEVEEPDHIVPLHIAADGSVQGHVAAWGECHTGYPGACVTAPPSPSDYAFFNLKQVVCSDGSIVHTGPVTVGTGHAGNSLNADRALAHYDNSGHGVADVVLRDGALGVWACGAARPTITPAQIREFNACGPSGDWRSLRGRLDLVAVLMVNTQGFPLVASGVMVHEGGRVEQQSLVAGLQPRTIDRVAAEMAGLRAEVGTLRATVQWMQAVGARLFAEEERDLFAALQASIEG